MNGSGLLKRSWRLGVLLSCLLLGVSTLGWAAQNAGYVGSDTCQGCHEERSAEHAGSLHGRAWKATGADLGCEACHGPGAEHAENPSRATIFSFGKGSAQSAEEQSAVCFECHATSTELAFWDVSRHAGDETSCTDCHNVHSAAAPKVDQTELCFSCHKDTRIEANRQSHHPIIEGKVSCNDCHNPHGTMTKGMLRGESNNQLCYTCHAEKRGPFVWQHPPVEENCATCHQAHGSRHNKLVTEKVPNLCENCHDWAYHPGTAYDNTYGFGGSGSNSSRNKLVGRSCLNCHSAIHGSNAPGSAGKTFTR